jgi:hypothetical protein
MGIISFIADVGRALDLDKPTSKPQKTKEEQELEKEMDRYGLEEEEKEAVRRGDYNPWDFEYPGQGDELDEDDYYYEDDEDNF